jgi:hypothetical protein
MRLVPDTVEGLELGPRLFLILNELGVTEIHLCEHALDKLMRSLQGLYSTPITDMTEIDAGWAGRLCGIKFYRDLNE